MEYLFRPDSEAVVHLVFGNLDRNARKVEETFGVSLINRGSALKIVGEPDDVASASRFLAALNEQIAAGQSPDEALFESLLVSDRSVPADALGVTVRGAPLRPRTKGQNAYTEALKSHTVTFAVGPAGTGKTYLAVAYAVTCLKNHEVSRIVLTRPAVEAGEKLGFLPGDLQEKVDPYLRPLYDALFDFLGAEVTRTYLERGVIEVAPLAYMRGRTLEDAYIILDEAQNTTGEQMKMFLTRLGQRSRMVITGDDSQIDLPDKKASGFVAACHLLDGIPEIAVCRLTGSDVVRNPLVKKIVDAYAAAEKKQ